MTKYRVAFYYDNELISGVDDMLFEERGEAAMYGLGCIRAYRFIEKILEHKLGEYAEWPLDSQIDLSYHLIAVEV